MNNVSNSEKLKLYVQRKYINADNYISKIDSCCTKGCNFCCYQSIELINVEIPLIYEFTKNNIKGDLFEKVKINLTNWFDFFDNNTPNKITLNADDVFDDFLFLGADNSLACPLLIGGLCSIYEMRPLTCRIHVVKSNPEECNIDKLRYSDEKAHDYRAEIKDEIKKYNKAYLVPLSFAIADIFLPKRKLKKIEKRIL